jgi:hypothetical protein
MRSSVGSSSLRRVRPSWIRNTNHVVVSINGCTQKRIVYNGKSQTKMDDLRVPHFGNLYVKMDHLRGKTCFIHGLGPRTSHCLLKTQRPLVPSDSPSAPWGGRPVPPVLLHLDASAREISAIAELIISYAIKTEDRPKFDRSLTLFC